MVNWVVDRIYAARSDGQHLDLRDKYRREERVVRTVRVTGPLTFDVAHNYSQKRAELTGEVSGAPFEILCAVVSTKTQF